MIFFLWSLKLLFSFSTPVPQLLIWKTESQKKWEKMLPLSWEMQAQGSSNLFFQWHGALVCVCADAERGCALV